MFTNAAQRWRNNRSSYRPARETINPLHYDVEEIAEDKEARAFVIDHHYSRSYPAARRRFGLYRHGELAGVAVLSHPTNDKAITNIFTGIAATDAVELGRFVLLDDVEANGESWFLARVRERIRNDFAGLLSFSDDCVRTDMKGNTIFCGHIGTCYQSSNAKFLGRGTPRTLKLLPDGSIFSERALQKIRGGERGWRYACQVLTRYGADEAPEEPQERKAWLDHWIKLLTRPLKHRGNLRYAWSLHSACSLPKGLPYPKLKISELEPRLFNG